MGQQEHCGESGSPRAVGPGGGVGGSGQGGGGPGPGPRSGRALPELNPCCRTQGRRPLWVGLRVQLCAGAVQLSAHSFLSNPCWGDEVKEARGEGRCPGTLWCGAGLGLQPGCICFLSTCSAFLEMKAVGAAWASPIQSVAIVWAKTPGCPRTQAAALPPWVQQGSAGEGWGQSPECRGGGPTPLSDPVGLSDQRICILIQFPGMCCCCWSGKHT